MTSAMDGGESSRFGLFIHGKESRYPMKNLLLGLGVLTFRKKEKNCCLCQDSNPELAYP
jgi:hypothetical protein